MSVLPRNRALLSAGFFSRLALFLSLSLFLVIFLELFFFQRESSQLLRGDFPPFYVAGKLCASFSASALYDFSKQAKLEQAYWPSLGHQFQAFVYPPSFAMLLSTFSVFSPLVAKLLYSCFQFFCFISALFFARSYIPVLQKNFLSVFVFSFSFLPLFSSIAAGQNSALILLLYSIGLFFLKRGTKRSDVLSGFFFGLLFFKPHYALFFLLLFLLYARRALLFGLFCGLFLHLFISCVAFGPDALFVWIEAVRRYVPEELRVNAFQHISLSGVLRALFVGSEFFNFVLLYVPSILIALFFFFNLKRKRNSFSTDVVLFSLPFCLLLSPHSLFYDLSLLILPSLRFFDAARRIDLLCLLFLFLSSTFFVLLREAFHFSPLIFLLLIFIILLSHRSGFFCFNIFCFVPKRRIQAT